MVDLTNSNLANLKGRIVAARSEEGAIIKRLAPASKSHRLVFRSENQAYDDIILENPEQTPIIGDIVFWWGVQ